MKRFTLKRGFPALALFVATLAGLPSWSDEPQPVVDPKDLPRIPPVAAAEAMKTFRLRKGFRLEQVAAEPLVVDPIAMSFDEDGRLFVVEMRDYPDDAAKRLGRIRRLEDTDGDGRFDKSTVYAKDLA